MRQHKLVDAGRGLFLLALLVPTYYPFAMMMANALKNTRDYYQDPLGLPSMLTWSNFIAAWAGISRYLFNTVIVGVISVALAISVAAMSAYVFARYRFVLREALFALYLGLLMIPGLLTLIGLYIEMKDFGILNNWLALIIPYAAGTQALGVFILRTFFASLPEELFEAGRVDGAGDGYMFLRIAVPLAAPSIGTVAILSALGIWGDYLWPTIALKSANMYTISAGVQEFASSFSVIAPGGELFAAYVIATVPVILLILATMRYYLAGVLGGGLKL